MHLISPYGANNLVYCATRENNISFKQLVFKKLKINIKVILLLAGRKVHFIAPCGANESIFWPSTRKKSCATLERPGHQTSHSQNKFFFHRCTIYFFKFNKHFFLTFKNKHTFFNDEQIFIFNQEKEGEQVIFEI